MAPWSRLVSTAFLPSSKLLASSIQDIQYAAAIFNGIQNPNLFMFNTMLRAYSINDDPKHAFHIFNNLRAQNITLDQFSFVATIKACARESTIRIGRGIHGVVMRSGFGLFVNVKNTLLQFYCVSGKIEDARKVFDEFPQRNDLVSLNTLMGGYLHASQPHVVVDLFKQMCSIGFGASATTVLNLLSAIGVFGSKLELWAQERGWPKRMPKGRVGRSPANWPKPSRNLEKQKRAFLTWCSS